MCRDRVAFTCLTVRSIEYLGAHPYRTQKICQHKLGAERPETLANRAIENLHRDASSQQLSRKTASKRVEIRERGGTRSTGRNEKPHRARGSAGLSSSQRLV